MKKHLVSKKLSKSQEEAEGDEDEEEAIELEEGLSAP